MAECNAIIMNEFGPEEVLVLSTKPMPIAAEGQVLLKVEAAGVNPSDTYVRLGPHGPWAATPHLIPALPFTPGKDAAGTIVAVGDGVDAFKVGERVYVSGSVSGTLADYAVCAVAQVYPLPDNISFAQGACVGVPCATAFRALLQRGAAKEGEAVLIHGASGAVGLAATQLAKSVGCFVVGTAGTEAGEGSVRGAGADAVVNHRAEGYLDAARSALPEGKNKFDLILEMAAHANLVCDLGLLAARGRVCIVGSKKQGIDVNPRLTMPTELDIRGVFLGNATAEERTEIHHALYTAMSSGVLTPQVGMELQLSDAPTAHKEVMKPSSGGANGNIVLYPPAKL